MFSFPLDFVLLLYQVFMLMKLHISDHCFKFCSFLNLKIFSIVKLAEKFRKNKDKIFHLKVMKRHLGLTRGPPLVQAASWHGLPPGRAHKAPVPPRTPLLVSL